MENENVSAKRGEKRLSIKMTQNNKKLYTFDKFEIRWIDPVSLCDWSPIDSYEEPAVCISEGYLIFENNKHINICNSFSANTKGDELVIPRSNVLEMKKINTKTFYDGDFIYDYDKKGKTVK